jgi:hypothetical protein
MRNNMPYSRTSVRSSKPAGNGSNVVTRGRNYARRPIPLVRVLRQEQPSPRVIIRSLRSATPLDVTEQVIAAIASTLWKVHGGNDVLNWLEAERALHAAMLEYSEQWRARSSAPPCNGTQALSASPQLTLR